ncbi:hypothetical protein C7974DRAFT_48027 [Boeremia exigua]|uniref:uncharacterized protein n=1 Tax=Boeremia exigua TaxID=749465 RepID=UPI001E8E0AD4|nr:uncharacterized protein C7974DRAFT_48027 [Boeremia exigua]KAH6616592.1 hypothetical protein C7974DRAFT_48027 [Boeremia exigua]
MQRRNSHESTLSHRESVHDVFDDEYEIDFDENDFMVSDGLGFRQTHANAEEPRTGLPQDSDRDRDRDSAPQRQYSTSKAPGSDLRRTATRNSTAKVRNSLVQDGRPAGLSNRPPVTQSPLHHRDSVSSTASFATTSMSENPFETGPSHPYGMYPQHTMDRSSSIASASTGRPDRPMSVQRPAHPYAMYSQSGLDDETPDRPMHADQPAVPPIQTAMPVGFPGLSNGYHRVLGPDGEEQDIIGPDGHTEQLPPYSRYPDEGPTKASMAAEASASRVVPAPLNVAMEVEDPFSAPASPVSPASEASFSLHALPAAAAAEPLLPVITPARLPPQRPETQTGNLAPISSANTIPAAPSDSSSASLLTAESGEFNEKYNEKGEPVSKKISWRKKRLFGKVPMGVVVIILVLLLIFAVALGAAIGTFAAKKQNNNDDDNDKGHGKPEGSPLPQVTGPSGSLFGATPISTPAGFASLPTGAFSLPLGFPQEANPGCLVQANEYSAWSCKMTFAPVILTINSTGIDSNGNTQQRASTRGGASLDGVIQYGAQTPQLDLQAMDLVLDLDYKSYGPAYHFHTRYDKVVILRPEELTAGSALKKRQIGDNMSSRQRFTVQPGDYPWYCYWNNTYIEGYIYAEDNSTAATFTALPTMWPTNSPTSTVTDVAAVAGATQAPSTAATFPTAAAEVIPTPTVARRDAIADAAASSSRIPPYPRVVKIEERRLPDSPQPYCQRMVLLDNGRIAPAPNGNDPAVALWLQEQDPTYDEYNLASVQNKRDVERRGDPSDSCHCQWMFK